MPSPIPIDFSPDLERFARERVASGFAGSLSVVVGEALALLRERKTALAGVRSGIASGLEQLERGEVEDGEAVFARLRQRSAERRAK